MKKEEFLKKLEESLSKLNEDDLKKVMRKYKATFTRKAKQNMSEEEIIESFGPYNELVNSILKEYNVETPTQESASTINDFFKEFLDAIENIVKYISKSQTTDIVKIILQLVVIVICISVLKLPVIFIRDLISNLFSFLFSPLDSVLIFCWRFICELIYIVIALAIFVKSYNIVLKPKLRKRKKSK